MMVNLMKVYVVSATLTPIVQDLLKAKTGMASIIKYLLISKSYSEGVSLVKNAPYLLSPPSLTQG